MSGADQAWVGDYLDRLLGLWRQHAEMPNGLFNPYLDRQWRHEVDGPRTLVSQCRLIYNFARAHERSGDPEYAGLAQRGVEALVQFFPAPRDAGWVWACQGDGSVADATYDAYGHAFVILALATAASAFAEDRYRDLAMQTWDFMQRRFRDEQGGLIWHVSPDGCTLDDGRSQNPLMHTFEALLALAPLDERGTVKQDALQIWAFISARQMAPGWLPEWFDPDWQPVAAGKRAIIEVGHLFEWAFLLSEAQDLYPEHDLLDPGRQFLAQGVRLGYDPAEGGVFSRTDYDGRVTGPRKGWWEQCEAIRAMQRYVARHDATQIAEPLAKSLDFARQHFVDEEFGGWYESPPGAGGEPSLVKGHMFKLDYHVVNMCRELLAG